MSKNIDKKEVSEQRLRVRQAMTALGPLLGFSMTGFNSGYSAVLLPQLNASTYNDTSSNFTSDDYDVVVTDNDEKSWIASSTIISMIPACWLCGFLLELLGRKRTTSLLFPLLIIGWLIIGIFNSHSSLIVGRLICGFSSGSFGPLTSVYIGETSDPVLRGVLLSMITFTLSIGILMVHAIGTWVYWRTTAYICAAFGFISWLSCLWSRESPTWLINKGMTDRALESWIYLRGQGTLNEFEALINSKTSKKTSSKRSAYSKLKKTFSSRNFLWPLGILSVFFATSQFSGYSVVTFYSVDILMDVTGPDYAYVGTLVIDVIRLVASGFGCYLIKRCNRRTITIISGFGAASALFLLSLSVYLDICRPWWPSIMLGINIACLTIGLVPLPWMLCGELFPRKYRGLGSGLISGLAFTFFFLAVKTAPAMLETLQLYGTYVFYGIITTLGTGFLSALLPETKNKTLLEVEKAFEKKSIVVDARNAEITTNDNQRF